MQKRRTKIIATLGPATDQSDALLNLLKDGVDLVRVNFSHGNSKENKKRVEQVRKQAAQLNIEIAVIADLQGPKIRLAKFKSGQVLLEAGHLFTLDADLDEHAGDHQQVGIDYKLLPKDVLPGDKLLVDDGRLVLQVEKIIDSKIITTIEVGGVLTNNKGINRQGGGLSASAFTKKDEQDLITALSFDADYIAISFPRDASDILHAKQLIENANGHAGVIAKIERQEAVSNLEAIIEVSDGVMVARGDLGVEIGDAALPGVQKHIIDVARKNNKCVITATQMMESMIVNVLPTRAEVFDVANAVLDGTDAVMLSAETANGQHPAKVVAAMHRICLGAEAERRAQISRHRMELQFTRADEAIAMATMYTANHLNIKAIIALTESGRTALWMSRIRSGIPIYALSRHAHTRGRMALFRGVYPIAFNVMQFNPAEINQQAVEVLKSRNIAEAGDLVILTKGDYLGVHGGSNAMKILRVDEIN